METSMDEDEEKEDEDKKIHRQTDRQIDRQ
jgi:hypothetical protein